MDDELEIDDRASLIRFLSNRPNAQREIRNGQWMAFVIGLFFGGCSGYQAARGPVSGAVAEILQLASWAALVLFVLGMAVFLVAVYWRIARWILAAIAIAAFGVFVWLQPPKSREVVLLFAPLFAIGCALMHLLLNSDEDE